MSKKFIVFVIFTIVFIECCVGRKRKQAHPKSTLHNGAAETSKNTSKHPTKRKTEPQEEEDPLHVRTGKRLSTWKDPKVNLDKDDSCVSDGK
uniref:Secreted protein n=1 Tax=Meloidogyne floridensis TaxID=298350 RepID=A0A915NUK1_9BILA